MKEVIASYGFVGLFVLAVAFIIFWGIVHLLGKPGTEISLLGIFKYTKRDVALPPQPAPVAREPEIEVMTINPLAQETPGEEEETSLTGDQKLVLEMYTVADETRLGSYFLIDTFVGKGGTKIGAEAALAELVRLDYLYRPGSFDPEDGLSYPLTEKGMAYLLDS